MFWENYTKQGLRFSYFCPMHQLRKIKRKDLDLEKYSKAIEEALNHRIYAEFWYLDILTNEKWECWVYGDYEVVMPIPLQYKFRIKFVLQPIFCQQLGVFYREEIPDELFREFEKKLHKYRVRAYHFNEENTERYQPKGELKINHVLDLGLPYDEIRKSYNRNRRRKLIDLPEEFELNLSESVDDLVDLFQAEYPNLAKPNWMKSLRKMMKAAFDRGIGYQCRIENEEGLVAGLFYIKTHKRIFQLGAGRKKEIKDIGFFTIIIDHTIRLFSQTPDFQFDFEGSSAPGIAMFNESFGAERKTYTIFSNY